MAGLASVALFRVGRFFARGARVFNYLAAGTLRVGDLRNGIERTWEEFGASDEAVSAGLMAWEIEFERKHLRAGDAVLLVGSGPGRDLIALVAKGYAVTAVEPARLANETARRHLALRGLSAQIIEGFFEDVDLPGRFNAIVFSYCCYSFIPDSRRRVAALRKAAAHLAPGGRIIISYLTERTGHAALIQLARAGAALARSDWRPEPGDILHAVDTSGPVYHYEHAFRPDEIEEEGRKAGMRTLDHSVRSVNPVVVLTAASE